MRLAFIPRISIFFFVFAIVAHAQEPYTLNTAMISMRDGVKLHTRIYTPTRPNEQFPILLLRTPYGIGEAKPAEMAAALPEITAAGYIIVQQDIRGRFKSDGEFVMLRQPRDSKDKNAIDESTDTYDTIDWLLKNVAQ
jgi:uncharacterized protein